MVSYNLSSDLYEVYMSVSHSVYFHINAYILGVMDKQTHRLYVTPFASGVLIQSNTRIFDEANDCTRPGVCLSIQNSKYTVIQRSKSSCIVLV